MMEKNLLYNSRIIDTYIKYIKKHHPEVDISAILKSAQMSPWEVADQSHWFNQKQIDSFYEKTIKLTRNQNIAREAGRYIACPEAMGAMRQWLLALIGPVGVFRMFNKACSNFTRSAKYECTTLKENQVEITVTPHEEVEEKPFQCQNRIGFFEGIFLLFNNLIPKIEHPECIFEGNIHCRYIVSWKNPFSKRWRKFIYLSIPISLISIFSSGYWFGIDGLIISSTLSLLTTLILLLLSSNQSKNELLNTLKQIDYSNDQLLEQMNINYNNATLTNEIGNAISNQTNIELEKENNVNSILKSISEILKKRLLYERGLILIASPDKSRLEIKGFYGYSESETNLLSNTSYFHLDKADSKGPLVVVFKEKKPILVNNLGAIDANLSPRSHDFAKKLGVKSFICVPIIFENEALGVLAVDNPKTGKTLIQSDINLLMGLAPMIGISIRNTELLSAKNRQFSSILRALAASIDARDPLTAGHSEKVTELAVGICDELKTDADFQEMVRVAALLHDYGKIAVPDAILKKPGRLTKEEYRIVKTHSLKTREILEQINFEGIYKAVPEIAGAHHEKLDGTGYPNGIQGNQIPFGAKIIAVADFFEAITAKRHYRDPMPLNVAFQLLRNGIGNHFEQEIVEALIRHFEKNHQEEFKRHWKISKTPERKSLRVPYRAPVTYTVNGITSQGTITDISTLGVYIAGEQEAVDEGTPIDLSFSLPNDPAQVVATKGRVAWINRKDLPRKLSFPGGFGVEFINIQKVVKDAVFCYALGQYIAV